MDTINKEILKQKSKKFEEKIDLDSFKKNLTVKSEEPVEPEVPIFIPPPVERVSNNKKKHNKLPKSEKSAVDVVRVNYQYEEDILLN